MIACLASHLEDIGASVEVLHDETGRKANLFARIGPEVPGGIMLSGHTDVVPAAEEDWQSDPFTMRADDARLYGRGACDMKGFIAASVAMAPLFAGRDLTRPLYFAFTHDEEVGCLGAQSLVEASARARSAARYRHRGRADRDADHRGAQGLLRIFHPFPGAGRAWLVARSRGERGRVRGALRQPPDGAERGAEDPRPRGQPVRAALDHDQHRRAVGRRRA